MAYNTGPKIVTDGLVLCLDAADRNSYPGSGSTWYDLSGNGNNGQTSGVTHQGSYFNFDGTNDTITTSISTPTIRTVFIVFRRNGTQTSSGTVLLGKRTTGCFDSALYLNYSTALRAYSSGPETAITGITDNTWYNIAVVTTSTTTDFYVNGSYQTGFSSIFNNNGMLENIGSTCSALGSLKGDIALIQAYSFQFSADQIQQNYNATKGRFGL
jgi:hypothetical protein